jgi:Rrf2 family protein
MVQFMQVSIKSRYGLRAMVYLAKAKRICSTREISQKENTPFNFLEKIISKLEKEGLAKAKRGSQGDIFWLTLLLKLA